MTTFHAGEAPIKPPDHVLTAKQAEDQLQPYKQLLEDCIQHGWDTWTKDYQPKHHILSSRARSAIVFDEIVSRAESTFSGLPGVTSKRYRNTFLLYIGPRIVVRFKKIGKDGRCSSIATRQQVLFQLQIELPGMEKGTMLHAGYALDDLQRKVIRKMIVCQFSNRVLWTIDLVTEAKGRTETVPLAPTPAKPLEPRFTAKTESHEKPQKKKPNERAAGKE